MKSVMAQWRSLLKACAQAKMWRKWRISVMARSVRDGAQWLAWLRGVPWLRGGAAQW